MGFENLSISLKVAVLALLLCCSCPDSVQGQRLSQGASDWYMRFYSNFDFVKRNVERPVTKSFIVKSTVQHRYAITEVKTVISNPETTGQQVFNFGFVIPREAFISKVQIDRNSSDGDRRDFVTSRFNESNYMIHKILSQDENDDDISSGDIKRTYSTGHANLHAFDHTNRNPNGFNEVEDELSWELIHGDRVNFKQFILPIRMNPMDEVTLTMTYEYALERTNNLYRHTISVFPGEIVKDLQVHLEVKENRPITNLKIDIPVVGQISNDSIEFGENSAKAVLIMDYVKQFDSFGRHGFVGDIHLVYDVDLEGGNEIVTNDGYFVHFYHGPTESSLMHSIPMHVLIVIDKSESMTGPKIKLAKELATLILKSLDDKFFVNMVLFDNEITDWKPEGISGEQEAYRCTNDTIETAMEFLKSIEASQVIESDLIGGVSRAIELDKRVWSSGLMPDNALTTIVLLTDGRLDKNSLKKEKEIVQAIKLANKGEQIPIFALGVGFDANMDLLKDISDRTPGGVAENIIEDLEVGPQMRALRLHLKDVILKNVYLNYIGKDFKRQTLSKNKYKFFHAGGAVTVSGKYDPTSPPRITITGQSVDGNYEEPLVASIIPVENPCEGTITLCSEIRLKGECITLDESRPSLKDRGFSNRASSIKITGNCAWIVCDLNNYRGMNLTLLPGLYEGIPDMHKTISSMRKVSLKMVTQRGHLTTVADDDKEASEHNSVARMWAFLTVRNALEREENNAWNNGQSKRKQTIIRAYQIAALFGFLTPFTDMYLEGNINSDSVEPEMEVVENNLITYKDLNPIFFQRDDPDIDKQWNALISCIPPIHCEHNFHIEYYKTDDSNMRNDVNQDLNFGKPNCNGTITVFTNPKFKGDHFTTDESLHQLYHQQNSQRMRSLKSEGDCCWLLFDHRFFSGDVSKVCGNSTQEFRKRNIGSLKRIGPQ